MGVETLKNSQEEQFLTFHVKKQTFGLDILFVREIIEYANVTPVPLVPEFIKGILNLRGKVVPVLDLSRRLGWEKTDIGRMTCIIITEIRHETLTTEIGLVVDAVNEVVKLSRDNLEASPNFGANVRADFVSQVGKIDGKFVLLLNIANLLDAKDIESLRGLGDSGKQNPTAANSGASV